MSTVVLVHPDDVNLADAKALAAEHDANLAVSRYVPRGQMFLAEVPDDPFALRLSIDPMEPE